VTDAATAVSVTDVAAAPVTVAAAASTWVIVATTD
jgi:hypothetical protein